ncbi:MAG: hypothetical protein K5893_11295 [Prevotella sp.]|nr:hypothetical protein [Prevotella sp.]
MNRKKAILIVSGLQSMALALFCVVFLTNHISLSTFIASVISIGVVSSALIFVIFKKLEN